MFTTKQFIGTNLNNLFYNLPFWFIKRTKL